MVTTDGIFTERKSQAQGDNSTIKDHWDYGLVFGYDYKLLENLDLGAEVWLGIPEVSYDLNQQLSGTNSQIRFGAKYWFK